MVIYFDCLIIYVNGSYDNMNKYTFQESLDTADIGTEHVTNFLFSLPNTINVENVEGDVTYQKQDVDLVWQTDNLKKLTIEIKVDNYAHSGNYFFETISNVGKKTEGCFMYSEADLLFYYFLNQELHIFNLAKARKWFIENQDDFRTVRTSTGVGNGRYQTEGALVKRDRFKRDCKCDLIITKFKDSWIIK
jgi:hypothetical protein